MHLPFPGSLPAVLRRIRFVATFHGLMLAAMSAPIAADAAQPASHVTTTLRVEGVANPIGIDVKRPGLSWRMQSDQRGTMQSAYHVQVARSADALHNNDPWWDSGHIRSDASVHVVFAGPPLESGQRYHWRVRTWNQDGEASTWSESAFWEMGLLQPSDWTASWITPAAEEDVTQSHPAPLLRRTFDVRGEVLRARLYATSLGLYEAKLNGRRVGDQVLAPGWTSYDQRLAYQTYDVTEHLQPGKNAIGVTLGNGWFRGPLTWHFERNMYGKNVALIAQLKIEYTDGRSEVVVTDPSWKTSTGPILMSEIYAGERYDARLEQPGWSTATFDDATWSNVRVLDHPKDILVAPAGPPVRRIEEIQPVTILKTPAGETVVDFGQNMVGWVRLKVRGPSGTTVTLRHAEVLDKDGNFYTANLRDAAQQVDYTLSGKGEEVYEPHFTFQGFRYVAVEGYPGEVTPDALTGVVLHSDMRPTGAWTSSNPLLNQLQHNIVWGQKGNFVDVPTDCPQRDERLGWTGDAQVFARTAAFNFDVSGFFTKWLRDLAADQKDDGAVPHVIPDVLSRGKPTDGSSGWADAATIVPWTMYLVYGDVRILETQYPSMRAWVEYIRSHAKDDLWKTGWHFGDWLSYATDSPDYPGATTGKDLIATAFYAHSTDLLARTARLLGKDEDAAAYSALFERIKAAFNREFVSPAGRVGESTQTAYALALQFNLLPEEQRSEAARRLAADVKKFGNHLTTGFLGTPYLCHVLADNGHLDTAYALLLQETYPSWLYPVKQGATTIWERWDGIEPDGSFQDDGMNSFNHYAYGAIGDWMYSVVAGIDLDPAEPGYKHVLIRPQPGGGLTHVRAAIDTQYGEVSSGWILEGDQFELTVTVPPNTRATIQLPGVQDPEHVTESDKPLKSTRGITNITPADNTLSFEAGSGTYRFRYSRASL